MNYDKSNEYISVHEDDNLSSSRGHISSPNKNVVTSSIKNIDQSVGLKIFQSSINRTDEIINTDNEILIPSNEETKVVFNKKQKPKSYHHCRGWHLHLIMVRVTELVVNDFDFIDCCIFSFELLLQYLLHFTGVCMKCSWHTSWKWRSNCAPTIVMLDVLSAMVVLCCVVMRFLIFASKILKLKLILKRHIVQCSLIRNQSMLQ